ncbi:ABC transporter ATP-binding protein [Occultella aeris]|uniref:Glutathione import ATP-binding protein GsiA n=1 Tax=Occultella aeris TaxID=2761496 RepID=A0A7M4DH45_9MICO|nr:ABC transporter ATP-binding protein [Occultella aeris]VZO36238.1 Glutathione import ATP-binding protein GsiA [Occultella aeris]
MTLLDVQDLSIVYEPRGAEPVTAVRGATFSLEQGEFIGLVGESGSGKSTLGFALTGLAKAPARISSGRITFDGTDIAHLDGEDLRRQRRGGFAMVLQSGMNALNPVRTIGNHFADIFAAHEHVPRARRRERAVELVEKVKLPASVLDRYPGELSGGMRQRVAIALAMSLDPRLLVFDEPTTALDVLVQRAVMGTIIELQREENFTAILVSHDLGVVLESTARVLVMHEGVIVEDGPAAQILQDPQDDYTKMLLSHYADPRAEVVELPGLRVAGSQISTTGEPPAAIGTDAAPSGGAKARTGRTREAVVLEGVGKVYPPPRRGEDPVVAVDDVSFTIEPGDALALVGASGSGKSTIAKLITGVERPTAGTVRLGGTDVGSLRRGGLRRLRRDVQMVFQDPYSALNPLHSVEYALMRPVVNFGGLRGLQARRRVLELLDIVGLAPVEQFAAKLPHQLSGGQRQRVVIARALACDPQVIIADEPVSMLDVSLRAGVLALIEGLREQWGVSLLFITHDLLSARLVTDKILVLNRGRVVERGETAQVLRFPEDAYTVELLDAVPQPGRAAD